MIRYRLNCRASIGRRHPAALRDHSESSDFSLARPPSIASLIIDIIDGRCGHVATPYGTWTPGFGTRHSSRRLSHPELSDVDVLCASQWRQRAPGSRPAAPSVGPWASGVPRAARHPLVLGPPQRRRWCCARPDPSVTATLTAGGGKPSGVRVGSVKSTSPGDRPPGRWRRKLMPRRVTVLEVEKARNRTRGRAHSFGR